MRASLQLAGLGALCAVLGLSSGMPGWEALRLAGGLALAAAGTGAALQLVGRHFLRTAWLLAALYGLALSLFAASLDRFQASVPFAGGPHATTDALAFGALLGASLGGLRACLLGCALPPWLLAGALGGALDTLLGAPLIGLVSTAQAPLVPGGQRLRFAAAGLLCGGFSILARKWDPLAALGWRQGQGSTALWLAVAWLGFGAATLSVPARIAQAKSTRDRSEDWS
jgi:hypothetical protein